MIMAGGFYGGIVHMKGLSICIVLLINNYLVYFSVVYCLRCQNMLCTPLGFSGASNAQCLTTMKTDLFIPLHTHLCFV